MKSGIGLELKYSMDTSAILHAWQRYTPDVFATLWVNLDELIDQRVVIASEEVLDELEVKHDEAWEWARQRDMFVPTDEEIQRTVSHILEEHPNLVDVRRERSGADPFVIALAQVEHCTVVTGEGYGTSKRPKIPDVCEALRIRCIDMLRLFRDQGWAF